MIAHTATAPKIPAIPAIRAISADPNTLLTAAEAAKLLRISMSHLRRIRLDGHGPRCIWLSKRKPVYRAIDIQIWIAERARAYRHSTPRA